MTNFLKIENFKGSLREHILKIRPYSNLRKCLNGSPNILNICKKFNINFSKVVEVGPSWPDVVAAKDIINDKEIKNKEIILIEARKNVCEALEQAYKHLQNVKIINCAISRKKGIATMYDYNHSTFLEGLNSPHVINQGPAGISPAKPNRGTGKTFNVECDTFDAFDEGDIDILLMDMEGAEFFVIEKMISRPSLIVCETHSLNPDLLDKKYINPYIDEIAQWMEEMDYSLYQLTYGDSVFIKNILLEK